jgi:hypothetical protein
MEIPSNNTPRSEKEIAEIENAVATVTKWELRPEDEWVRRNLLDLVAGEMGVYQSALPKVRGETQCGPWRVKSRNGDSFPLYTN